MRLLGKYNSVCESLSSGQPTLIARCTTSDDLKMMSRDGAPAGRVTYITLQYNYQCRVRDTLMLQHLATGPHTSSVLATMCPRNFATHEKAFITQTHTNAPYRNVGRSGPVLGGKHFPYSSPGVMLISLRPGRKGMCKKSALSAPKRASGNIIVSTNEPILA